MIHRYLQEPWPNAAHGSILAYSGVQKMAYYYTRAAMAMVDVSLLYTGLTVRAGVPMANNSVSVWIDSELAVRPTNSSGTPYFSIIHDCIVYFDNNICGVTGSPD